MVTKTKRNEKSTTNPQNGAVTGSDVQEVSPKSGTQVLASQTTTSETDGDGNIVISGFSLVQAREQVLACAASWREANLRLLAAMIVTFMRAVLENRGGKKTYDEVTTSLMGDLKERDVKRTYAYDILKTARGMTIEFFRKYRNGGPVKSVIDATSAQSAVDCIMTHFHADMKVTSLNAARIAYAMDARYTQADEKQAQSDREYNKTATGKAAKTREANARAAERIAEQTATGASVLNTVVAKVAKLDKGPERLFAALASFLDQATDQEALQEIINRAQHRLEMLKAIPKPHEMPQQETRPVRTVN